MRRDQFRARVQRRHQHALMKVWPVKRLPKLPCDGAFRIVAVATQVAEVDATAQHKDRDEQRGQELPLWLTEPGHLFQDVVDYCHKPFTGSSGSGIRSPHLTSSWPHLFTLSLKKCPKYYIYFYIYKRIRICLKIQDKAAICPTTAIISFA